MVVSKLSKVSIPRSAPLREMLDIVDASLGFGATRNIGRHLYLVKQVMRVVNRVGSR
jgi:hypothetical protein